MAADEGRSRVIFDRKLDGLCDLVALQSSDQRQREIEARGHAAAGDDIPVFDDPCGFVGRADQRQQMRIAPVRRRAPARQQARAAVVAMSDERCIAFSKGQMTAKQARAKLLSIARFTPASILNVVGGAA